MNLFTILIVACGLCIGTNNANSFLECPHSYPLCRCTKITKEDGTRKLEIECVGGDHRIAVVKELSTTDKRFVRVDCGYSNDSFAASIIPTMGVANIYGLQIQHCHTSSPKTALMPIFNRLGLARVSLARLEIMENALVQLPRDLLQDLPQLTHLNLRSNSLKKLKEQNFRKLANLTVLDLGDNQLTSIPSHFFANFQHLRFLNLWNNSLTALHGVAFAGLAKLEQIDLSCNHLQSIAADIFTDLRSLTTINLSGNNFASLPENLLVRNPRLNYFRLNNNRTPLRLSNKLFIVPKNLKIVELSSSKLPQLPEAIFGHNSNLQELSLARNEILALPSQIFSNQRNLIRLDLSHNSLITLDENLLNNMTKLEVVKLSHNLIETIPESTFLTLKAVNEVYLDNNNLTDMSTHTFEPTQRSLKILNLSNNNLPNIIPSFHSFHSLVLLDLSGNNLDTILESDLLRFTSTAPILTIQLEHSAIRHIDFKQMHRTSNPRYTVQVYLQSNPLQCDCDILGFLRFLLDTSSRSKLKLETDGLQCDKPRGLSKRYVKSLKPADLECLSSFKCPRRCHCSTKDDVLTVNCDGLNLREIPRMASTKGQNIVLHLSHDGITTLPVIKQRIGQGNLTEIYAQSNKISKINLNTLQGLRGLTVLDLSRNLLTDFADDVFQDTSLRTFRLTANKFTKIENHTFAWLNLLSELHMDHNQLHTIDDDALFIFCKSMETLILHHNALTSISKSFRMLEALETLDLSHNHIQKLNSVDLQSISKASVVHINLVGAQLVDLNFENIEKLILVNPTIYPKIMLNIQNNSIACGCGIYEYVRYVQGKMNEKVYRKLTVNDHNVTCASPSHLAHRQVSNLKLDEITCVSDAPTTALAPAESKTSRDCECYRYKDICPHGCCCCFAIFNGEFRVNCTRADYTAFPNLSVKKEFKSIVLYMAHNNITELPKNDKENYELVTEIHVEHNQIATLNSSNLLPNLQSINLTHNQLQTVDKSLLVRLNASSLKTISLAHNPWICDCELKNMRSFFAQYSKFADYSSMLCSLDQHMFSRTTLCDDPWFAAIKLLSVVLVALLLTLAIGCVLYLQYREEIKVWMFAHNIFPGLVNEKSLDYSKKYDAFISYSEEDTKYLKILMKTLESGPEPYKLCVHDRDWAPGEWIIDQIINSVEESRRTIILLSPHFIKSVWAKTELRIAHLKAMQERRSRVIIVIVDQLDDLANLEPELKVYLNTNTYVKWKDNWFWEKLRYALNKPLGEVSRRGLLENMLMDNDDRLSKPNSLDNLVSIVTNGTILDSRVEEFSHKKI